jgi:hypothetical protein
VFPSWEDGNGGTWRVGSGGMGAGDDLFHGAAHAFVVVLWVSDVSRVVPCVWCVTTDGLEDGVFWV